METGRREEWRRGDTSAEPSWSRNQIVEPTEPTEPTEPIAKEAKKLGRGPNGAIVVAVGSLQ